MANELLVYLDHDQVGAHPSGSTMRIEKRPAGDSLIVIEPDGSEQEYEAGKWHGAGQGLVCAYMDERDGCPNCGG